MALDNLEFEQELMDAFKVRGAFTDDYKAFEAPDVIERSIDIFLDAIARIDGQLDDGDHLAYASSDDDWGRRARAAKRLYQREVQRLRGLMQSAARDAARGRAEANRARFTEWSRQVHNLIEELALRCEDRGAPINDLCLPANDPDAEPMTLTDWLDLREEKRSRARPETEPL